MAGPMNPPRFPMEFINPIYTAADVSVKNIVGNEQKGSNAE